MNPASTLLEAADHVVELVMQIARGAHALIKSADTLNARQIRAARHINRIFELCALLVFRLTINPGHQPRPPAEPLQTSAQNAKTDTPATNPQPPESPERPERTDRADTLPRGSHLSTIDLVAEINRQLHLAVKALGYPLAADLETLCHEAIAAATQLQNASTTTAHPKPRRSPAPNQTPETHPEPPEPRPVTTLEL